MYYLNVKSRGSIVCLVGLVSSNQPQCSSQNMFVSHRTFGFRTQSNEIELTKNCACGQNRTFRIKFDLVLSSDKIERSTKIIEQHQTFGFPTADT